MVDKIMLEAKRIVFVHEPFTKAEASTPLGIITSVSAHSLKAAKKARILCFPRVESFNARIYLSHSIHIDKTRHIEIECTSGWNEIAHAEVRLKSASAGLRLRSANASVASGEVSIIDKTKPGVVTIGPLSADSSATLKIPYDMETILQDLNIKIEVDYFTEHGQLQYFSSCTIPVDLPLDVNVHDHFKQDTLLSKFNIKTANHIPLQLFGVNLESSGEFQVQGAQRSRAPSYVFAKQPVAITYKIEKKATEVTERRKSKSSSTGSLALSVEYRCLNEDVRVRLSKKFKSDVAQGPAHRLGRLLTDTFEHRLEHKILPHQYERIALLEKVDMGAFEDMDWSECVDSLPEVIRPDTQAWLQRWHEVSNVGPKHRRKTLTRYDAVQQNPSSRLRVKRICSCPCLAISHTSHGHHSLNPADPYTSHCITHAYYIIFPHDSYSRPACADSPAHISHSPLGLSTNYTFRTTRIHLYPRSKPRDLAHRRPTSRALFRARRRGSRVARPAYSSEAWRDVATECGHSLAKTQGQGGNGN